MKRCNLDCQFISEFDLFGKEPELYFKGKPQRTSLFGKILTYFYIVVYVGFFIYKIIRMLKKVDITFYETYAFSGFPSIQLSSENFYGGFALGGMVEETIYYPKAFYYKGHRVDGVMVWEDFELELEICQLEKFGSKYQDMFKNKDLNNLYCLKDVGDVTLEGYSTLESYSYFYVAFFPCVGQTKDGRPCQHESIIDKFFQLNALEFKMQDIELTPQIYDSPSEPKEKDIASPIYRLLYQQIYAYLQIVILETDQDVVGFEGLSNIKTEKFLKYEESWIIAAPSPHYYAFDPTKPICDVTVRLSEKVLTQKRKSTKLIEVLGNVGGLMGVVWSFLSIISTIISNILYDKAIVNNLFSFDLDKKRVMIKNKNNQDNNVILPMIEEPRIYNPNSNFSPTSSFNTKDELTIKTRKNLNEEALNKRLTNENILTKNTRKKKKKKAGYRQNIQSPVNIENYGNNQENKNNEEINSKKPNRLNVFSLSNSITSFEKMESNEMDRSKRNIIPHIKLNKCCIYFCFCFARKKNNIHNILLDEGMKVVTEKLDILNIFKILYKAEILKESFKSKDDNLEMSDACKQKLQALSKYKSI